MYDTSTLNMLDEESFGVEISVAIRVKSASQSRGMTPLKNPNYS